MMDAADCSNHSPLSEERREGRNQCARLNENAENADGVPNYRQEQHSSKGLADN
jgi:hypothetical protein